MRIAVTGAAGFIGSRITTRLLEQGHHVFGVDNFSEVLNPSGNRRKRIEHLKKSENFTFIESDISSPYIADALEGVSAIINEAAIPGQAKSWDNFDDYVHSNLIGVNNLVKVGIDLKIEKFIQASTSSVYGKNAIGLESSTLNPFSPYGVTKLAAENLLMAYHQNLNFPVTVLRYFSVYGPGQRPDMAAAKFLTSLRNGNPIYVHGDGSQLRDVTFVDDVVSATLLAMDKGKNGEIYNIAGGHQLSLIELLKACQAVVGIEGEVVHAPRPLGDQEETMANISKAKMDLGYKPSTLLLDGLKFQLDQIIQDQAQA